MSEKPQCSQYIWFFPFVQIEQLQETQDWIALGSKPIDLFAVVVAVSQLNIEWDKHRKSWKLSKKDSCLG